MKLGKIQLQNIFTTTYTQQGKLLKGIDKKLLEDVARTYLQLPLGGIHKQRVLRGGGRGSPLKVDLLHKPI